MSDAGGEGENSGTDEVAAVLARLPPVGTPTDKDCAGCGLAIHVGQHYIRVAVMFDTAGLEAISLLRLPDGIPWTAIAHDPLCGGIALLRAAKDEIFTDVFNR